MDLTARPSGPLRGQARPPSDKSMSHRALILGALAAGETDITNLLEGADVLATARAMAAFGADVRQTGEGTWRVTGRGAAGFAEPASPLDFGNAGTGVRLTMGAAARFPLTAVYVGDASLSGRPMARITGPLERMGAVALSRAGGRLPVTIRGGALAPITHESASASAQVKSAVLLAGLGAKGVTTVVEPAQSRDHTERMLEAFGAPMRWERAVDGRWAASVLGPAQLIGQAVAVPADPSSAAFAIAAAAIRPGSAVALTGVCLNPLRTGFFDAARSMGVQLDVQNPSRCGGEDVGDLDIRGAGGLRGVEVPPNLAPSMIDEYPILAALAAFAEGETRLTGAAELRVKESDRIALMVQGLRACGVEAEELPDGLIVRGRGPGGVAGGARVDTHGDHRIAMSFLVLGLGAQAPVTVADADMIATSFPGFAAFMGGLGADIG